MKTKQKPDFILRWVCKKCQTINHSALKLDSKVLEIEKGVDGIVFCRVCGRAVDVNLISKAKESK